LGKGHQQLGKKLKKNGLVAKNNQAILKQAEINE
jgi:hypothetical protein